MVQGQRNKKAQKKKKKHKSEREVSSKIVSLK